MLITKVYVFLCMLAHKVFHHSSDASRNGVNLAYSILTLDVEKFLRENPRIEVVSSACSTTPYKRTELLTKEERVFPGENFETRDEALHVFHIVYRTK